jgi:hypothetical protein
MTHIRLAKANEDVLAGALRTAWMFRRKKNSGTKKKRAPKGGWHHAAHTPSHSVLSAVLVIGSVQPRSPKKTCCARYVPSYEARGHALRASTTLSCKTFCWPVLVRDRQALDRSASDPNMEVGALHTQRPDLSAEDALLATRIRPAR